MWELPLVIVSKLSIYRIELSMIVSNSFFLLSIHRHPRIYCVDTEQKKSTRTDHDLDHLDPNLPLRYT